MRRSELVEVKGKGDEGKAKAREVKVGCVFTQHPRDGEEPWRPLNINEYEHFMKESKHGTQWVHKAITCHSDAYWNHNILAES